jgi:propionyl-CoA synthetase
MPAIPETIISMLACARIGAVHSVVFGGFASKELAARIDDACPKVIVTASAGVEKGEVLPFSPLLEGALQMAKHVPGHVVVKHRDRLPGGAVTYERGQVRPTSENESVAETAYHEFSLLEEEAAPVPCVPLKSSDPLYTLYTSGTTGAPKAVMRDQTHAVSLAWSMEHFMRMQPGETYWAASDLGWVRLPTYIYIYIYNHAIIHTIIQLYNHTIIQSALQSLISSSSRFFLVKSSRFLQ